MCTRKEYQEPLSEHNSKVKGTLDIVHSYVCGPMKTTSLSVYVYYASVIDDYSRKTWIYFLKKKDELFERFKEFKALVENLSKKRTEILRSDNGGEFTMSTAKKPRLRGSSPFPIIHNKMVWQKERIDLSQKL